MTSSWQDSISPKLRVQGGSGLPCTMHVLEFDDYIPVRVRMYNEPTRVGYLRLGGDSANLLEIAVEPSSQRVLGLTATLIEKLSAWPSFEVLSRKNEHPVISTDFDEYAVVDLARSFHVAVRACEILIFWGELGDCDGYVCRDSEFLVRNEHLLGVCLKGVQEAEMARFLASIDHPLPNDTDRA